MTSTSKNFVSSSSSRTASTSTAADDWAPAEGIGWLFFAASILGIAGVMRIVDSIWAFNYHGALPENLRDGVLGSELHNYAWLWLVVGSLLIISSFLVLVQNQFGRWFGIIAAGVGCITSAAWLPYYPVWSLVYIALTIMVIYALAVYGGHESA